MTKRPDGITVIRLDPERVSEVGRLEELCFSEPWSEGAFLDACGNGMYDYFIAVDPANGYVCGYGGMYSVLDTSEITNIAVLPDYRRRGIGGLILERLTEEAEKRGSELLQLEVRESNLPASALYEKLGFKIVGRRKNYYRRPTEDAILMTKELSRGTGEQK